MGKRDVKSVIDVIFEKNQKTPDILLLIAGCDASKNCIEFIDYDINGDEFYLCPHIYCDFRSGRHPYEKIVYYIIGDDENGCSYDQGLNNNCRVKII